MRRLWLNWFADIWYLINSGLRSNRNNCTQQTINCTISTIKNQYNMAVEPKIQFSDLRGFPQISSDGKIETKEFLNAAREIVSLVGKLIFTIHNIIYFCLAFHPSIYVLYVTPCVSFLQYQRASGSGMCHMCQFSAATWPNQPSNEFIIVDFVANSRFVYLM